MCTKRAHGGQLVVLLLAIKDPHLIMMYSQ